MTDLNYIPHAWYWLVGGSETQVYSSAAAGYVAVDDEIFAGWLADGGIPTAIETEAELWDVLRKADIPPFHSISTNALVNRLEAAGKADAADDYMVAHRPLRRRFFTVGRIYADDPDLVAMLTAIGADEGTLLARDVA